MKTGRYTEEFGSLVRKIKGGRTFAKFSVDTGLSVATLSKYVSGNGRGNIKPQTLQALIDPASFPQGEVTLSELYEAAGIPMLREGIIRVDKEELQEANDILVQLGLDVETAVDIFLRQIIIHNGLPIHIENEK